MKTKRIDIERLSGAFYNPRMELRPGNPTFEKLKRSIETFGCLQPIVVNRRNYRVVGGHQRLAVLRHLAQVPQL